jgi:hypothetical protein
MPLAARAGMAKLDEDFLPEVEFLSSICIHFVSNTTQEYFGRTQISWFPDAQRDIATTCVIYLLFDAFESSFCPTDEEFEERLRLNPLYDYAARN